MLYPMPCTGTAPVPHLVEVFTSDQQGSSYTDMILNIVGDLGEAGPFELANDDQCRFIQNAHSQFHVDLPDIGGSLLLTGLHWDCGIDWQRTMLSRG